MKRGYKIAAARDSDPTQLTFTDSHSAPHPVFALYSETLHEYVPPENESDEGEDIEDGLNAEKCPGINCCSVCGKAQIGAQPPVVCPFCHSGEHFDVLCC